MSDRVVDRGYGMWGGAGATSVAPVSPDDLPRLFRDDDEIGLDDDTVFDVQVIGELNDHEPGSLVPDARLASGTGAGTGTMVYGARPAICGELTNFRITAAFLSGGGREQACARVVDVLCEGREGHEIRAIFRAAHVCQSPTPHAYYDAWGWPGEAGDRRMRWAQEQEEAGAEHERTDRD